MKQGATLGEVKEFIGGLTWSLSPQGTAQLKTDVNAVTMDLLTARSVRQCRETLRTWVDQHAPLVMPPLPTASVIAASPYWRFKAIKANPERWLPYMVAMSRTIEALSGRARLSPLPLRTSFIPNHIRLDSQGLVDLLLEDQDDMTLLKAEMEGRTMPSVPSLTYKLPGLVTVNRKTGKETVSKGQLFMDLKKIVAPELVRHIEDAPERHAAEYRTSLWSCITKLGINKHAVLTYDGLVFNNVIDTDGFSVSMHYVSPELYGKTCFNGGFAEIRSGQRQQRAVEKAKGSRFVTDLSAAERQQALLEAPGTVISGDPGKGVILTVTDGHEIARYTAAQRHVESGAKRHCGVTRRLLDLSVPGGPTNQTFQMLQNSVGENPDNGERRTRRTCDVAKYADYLKARRAVSQELSTLYRWMVFRRMRYDAYLGRRSSEDRFVHRIRTKFGDVKALLYGAWGASPNLKHQPPSPGVGLRRRLASHFPVYVTPEPGTSSVCPCCSQRGLCHPRRRVVAQRQDPMNHMAGGAQTTTTRAIHHLLRCTNPRCPHPWWHRDTLGSLNIRVQGLHVLEHGVLHPMFRFRNE